MIHLRVEIQEPLTSKIADGEALLYEFLCCALPLNDLLVSPVFDEQPARLAAARFSALERTPAAIGLIGMGSEFAGQLSLHLRGRVPITAFGNLPPTGSAALPPILVVTEPYRADLLARGYRLEACGFLRSRWTARELWRTVTQGTPLTLSGKNASPSTSR